MCSSCSTPWIFYFFWCNTAHWLCHQQEMSKEHANGMSYLWISSEAMLEYETCWITIRILYDIRPAPSAFICLHRLTLFTVCSSRWVGRDTVFIPFIPVGWETCINVNFKPVDVQICYRLITTWLWLEVIFKWKRNSYTWKSILQKLFQYYCKHEYRQRAVGQWDGVNPREQVPWPEGSCGWPWNGGVWLAGGSQATEDCRLAVEPVEATDRTSRETPLFLLLFSSPLSFDPCSSCWQFPVEEHSSRQIV